jgi:hypothetical protein
MNVITKETNPILMQAIKSANLSASSDYMTKEEAESVTLAQLKTVNFTGVETFNEFQYFTGITNITNKDNISTFTSLKEITIPENTTFNNGATNVMCNEFFKNAVNLNPNKVIQLGDRKYLPPAFYGKTNGITEYTVPDNIYAVGGQLLQSATTIKTLNLNQAEYIGGRLLGYMDTALETIIFGENTKEICTNTTVNVGTDGGLLDGATKPNFRGIFIKATNPPLLGASAFSYITKYPKAKIFVPEDYFNLYKEAEVWSNYLDYLTPYNYHTIRVTDIL